MTPALVEELRSRVDGAVRTAVPLASRTTLKVGGPAAVLVTAETPDDIVEVARACVRHGCSWFVLGRGSNVLVADEGIDGVVVELGRGFRGVDVDGTTAVAGGAERMPALAHVVAARGLAGLSFGVAIPGTVGGAVRMNAGAHGHDTAEVLAWADVVRLGGEGRVERLPAAGLRMTYRHTKLPADAVVVRAAFTLRRADDAELARNMDEMKRWRREHQPLGEPSCGSVFRNPPGDSAGRLIDSAGLKGHSIGSARVSTKHANFITASGGARAADVLALIRHIRGVVAERHGVRLVPEVVLVGFGDHPLDGDSSETGNPSGAGNRSAASNVGGERR